MLGNNIDDQNAINDRAAEFHSTNQYSFFVGKSRMIEERLNGALRVVHV